jgi:site-specific DNA-methyltransferase (adenine-specific)
MNMLGGVGPGSRCSTFGEGLIAGETIGNAICRMTATLTNHLAHKLNSVEALATVASASRAVVVISVPRGAAALAREVLVGCLPEAVRALRPGGLLFIYGQPAELPQWGEYLLAAPEVAQQVGFKYWIALDLNEQPRENLLQPVHQGLLLFLKRDLARKSPPPFRLQVNEVRVPHRDCPACGQNVKDWGGKKHLINPLGAAPSDVWRDFPRRPLPDGEVPADVLLRIAKLAGVRPEEILQFAPLPFGPGKVVVAGSVPLPPRKAGDRTFDKLPRIELDQVYAGDCISFLHRVEVLHPKGLFDLAFADPPYNLEKNYSQWDDAMADQHYLDWCNQWLAGMAATLKPGGSLFVLNLPKWAIYHAAFLQRHLDFRHWIAWDALSDPRGKLMPAHYALLWFTKPGGKPVCNYTPLGTKPRPDFVAPPDAPQYCLRAKCVQQRKALGDDAKVELTDIWSDIHRIKHKRDRDAHPCQLPEKLMERIIKLASKPGDVVFDPFCGAGTTAIAALKLGRKFVTTELDKNYVRITNEKLAAMREHADMFGEFVVPRESTRRQRGDVTKREIESYLQELAQKLQRLPTEEDVLADRPGLLPEIDRIYPNRGAAFKRAKIGL